MNCTRRMKNERGSSSQTWRNAWLIAQAPSNVPRNTSTRSVAIMIRNAETPWKTCHMKQSCGVKWKAGESSVPTNKIALCSELTLHLWAPNWIHSHLYQHREVASKIIKNLRKWPRRPEQPSKQLRRKLKQINKPATYGQIEATCGSKLHWLGTLCRLWVWTCLVIERDYDIPDKKRQWTHFKLSSTSTIRSRTTEPTWTTIYELRTFNNFIWWIWNGQYV